MTVKSVTIPFKSNGQSVVRLSKEEKATLQREKEETKKRQEREHARRNAGRSSRSSQDPESQD
jgi:hypothetical protein